jgi:hypothetical protein
VIPPTAIAPAANPPNASSSPIDAPPKVTRPKAKPPRLITPIGIAPMEIMPIDIVPMAMIPFATEGLPYLLILMWTSGMPKTVRFDLYSYILFINIALSERSDIISSKISLLSSYIESINSRATSFGSPILPITESMSSVFAASFNCDNRSSLMRFFILLSAMIYDKTSLT